MDTLEELKKKRAKLDKKIEELERDGDYSFKKGDDYWVVFSDGVISALMWDNISIDKDFDKQGNAFHTEKEAELEADRRNFLHRFKMFRDKCNGEWKADFEDFNRKYFIIFNADSGNSVVTYQNFYEPFNIFGYFKNESDAIKAITLFGDEIKKLFVDCECD